MRKAIDRLLSDIQGISVRPQRSKRIPASGVYLEFVALTPIFKLHFSLMCLSGLEETVRDLKYGGVGSNLTP